MYETWKDIPYYVGKYQVSNLGNVRSLHWNNTNQTRIIKPFCSSGYKRVCLFTKGKQKKFLIHVLVAKVFIPNPYNKPIVNHIDGNKLNNQVSNLEWVTHSENVKHAIDNNLVKVHPSRWKPSKTVQLSLDGEIIAVYQSQREASRCLNINQAKISQAIKTNKPYANYLWKKDF